MYIRRGWGWEVVLSQFKSLKLVLWKKFENWGSTWLYDFSPPPDNKRILTSKRPSLQCQFSLYNEKVKILLIIEYNHIFHKIEYNRIMFLKMEVQNGM